MTFRGIPATDWFYSFCNSSMCAQVHSEVLFFIHAACDHQASALAAVDYNLTFCARSIADSVRCAGRSNSRLTSSRALRASLLLAVRHELRVQRCASATLRLLYCPFAPAVAPMEPEISSSCPWARGSRTLNLPTRVAPHPVPSDKGRRPISDTTSRIPDVLRQRRQPVAVATRGAGRWVCPWRPR